MAWIKQQRGFNAAERDVTPESVYLNRRRFMGGAIAGTAGLAATTGSAQAQWSWFTAGSDDDFEFEQDPTADLYPVLRNPTYTAGRELTPETDARTYNNFYEFGSHKQIWRGAQSLPLRPWEVVFDGMVEQEQRVDFDTLVRAMPLEERIYRHRCVEAWAMTVPWSGFPMKALIDYARPTSSAKYVRMETFSEDHYPASGFRQYWYPWPYVEGLTMEEAVNELSFIATGLYGKPIYKQNGAPLRLVTPWKYGFKCVKSLVRFTFTDQRPVSFWERLQGREYGFWANVNPDVPHPRWSQATERLLGSDERVPTQIYNGYGEYVAHMYTDLPDADRQRLYM